MRSLREQIEHLDSRKHHWVWSIRDGHLVEKEVYGPFRGEEQPVVHQSGDDFPDEEKLDGYELRNQDAHRQRYDTEIPHAQYAHSLYKGGSSSAFNDSLRNNFRSHDGTIWRHPYDDADGESHENIHRAYDAMDGITSHPTVRPFHAYRGFSQGLDPTKLPMGHQFVDHGYTGMSLKKHFSASYSAHFVGKKSSQLEIYRKPTDADRGILPEHRVTRAVARIHVPAGSYGHYLDLENYHHSGGLEGEKEFTTRRGSIFQVTGHSSISSGMYYGHNIHIVHMNLVHQPEITPVRIRK